MTRNQLAKEICDRLNLKGLENRQLVKHILEQEEDIVYECIALEDSLTYIWGKIGGTQRWPRRIGGPFAENETVRKNFGWSTFKRGVPTVKWSDQALLCDEIKPQEFFEEDGHKYTTAAKVFRKDAGLPEIPEYEGLTEEQKMLKCKMADEIEVETYLTPTQQQNNRRLSDLHRIEKLSKIKFYKEINHKPMNMLYDENLGDENWSGEQRSMLSDTLEKLVIMVDPVDKFNYLTNLVCALINRAQYTRVEELYELHKEAYNKVIEAGKTPEFNLVFVRSNGRTDPNYLQEQDPWGLSDKQIKDRERFKFFTEYFKRFGVKPVFINGKLKAKDLDYDYNWEEDDDFLNTFVKKKPKNVTRKTR